MKKLRSLIKYIKTFSNWWNAAFAKYLKHKLGPEQTLNFRDGRKITFRPGSDYVALGEVFCIENYSPCLSAKDIENVWDIGGNIGSFVLWHASKTKKVKYCSFEPCEETYKLLSRNQQQNPSIKWTVQPFGLSNKNEKCEAFVPDMMYGQTSKYSTQGKKVILPLRDINEVWNEMGKPKINLLKVDCEGGEYAIFQGCSTEFLANVDHIIMEVHILDGYDSQDIRERINNAGFSIKDNLQDQAVIWANKH